ncbi:hypothetical protein PHYPSEUDO_002649 [Phytophthora pseudosyringae]|uniref:BZIP domain-containing protein n=1 Tax=Phytophthora pseudosyringae TaxID=221518 RepID=A0A8T1VVX0_9STRA|nr:hypothetical protein PHYPSEUDO_002649 [Phytophthora pseudosyringae]
MSSESLEEALALLAEELQPTLDIGGGTATLSPFGADSWNPDELLASIDNDIGDFRIDLTPPSDSNVLEDTTQETHAAQGGRNQVKPRRRRKQLNSNRARDERRFEVVQLRREVEDLELTLQQLKTIRSQEWHQVGEKSADKTEEEEASGMPVNDPKTTALIDFLVSALSANITVRNETVENLLLDQALEKHNCNYV